MSSHNEHLMLDELGVFTQQREETDETVYRVAVTYKPIRICSHQQRVLLHACSATAQQMCQVFFFFLVTIYLHVICIQTLFLWISPMVPGVAVRICEITCKASLNTHITQVVSLVKNCSKTHLNLIHNCCTRPQPTEF